LRTRTLTAPTSCGSRGSVIPALDLIGGHRDLGGCSSSTPLPSPWPASANVDLRDELEATVEEQALEEQPSPDDGGAIGAADHHAGPTGAGLGPGYTWLSVRMAEGQTGDPILDSVPLCRETP